MRLDRDTEQFLNSLSEESAPALHELPIGQAREKLKELTAVLDVPSSKVDRVEDRTIPTDWGGIDIRIYWPSGGDSTTSLGIFVMYHGGGFVMGDVDTHDNVSRFYCAHGRVIVISVDYRLAPEHPFPAAVDDSYAALCWVYENASSLGGARDLVAVGGDSAGGNLSAVVCQIARDRKGPPIALQVLIYPVVSATVDSVYPSRSQFAGGEYFLSTQDFLWFNQMYLPNSEQERDVLVSPILADSMHGLPPALVITAGFDPLRDEGRHYYERLKEGGVDASYRCFESTIHGFMSFAGQISVGLEGLHTVASALSTALSPQGLDA
ncbi:MAG: alpha/beta hydrolase [Pseudomonadota bacterium]